MPYISIATDSAGGYKPCVTFMNQSRYKDGNLQEYLDSDWLKNLKKQHMTTNLPDACRMCRIRDENKVVSTRQRCLDHYLNKYGSLDNIKKQTKFEFVFFITSNHCNQACIMCTPLLSNKIYEETTESHMEHYVSGKRSFDNNVSTLNLSKPYTDNELYQILDNISPNAFIHISGGEPMVSKPAQKILTYLIDKKLNHSIELEIVSNFQSENRKFIDLLSQFTGTCRVVASVDAIGSRAEYIRYRSNWNNIEYNILKFKEKNPNFKFIIKPTLSVLNILYLDEIIDWCARHSLDVRANSRLINPDWLSIKILPNSTKHNILKKYKDVNNEILNLTEMETHLFKENTSSMLIKKFFTEIRKNDSMRNTSFEKTLPEVYSALADWEHKDE